MRFTIAFIFYTLSFLAIGCQCENFTTEDFIEDAKSIHLVSITSASVAQFPRNRSGAEVYFDVIENLLKEEAAPISVYVLDNNCSTQLWPGHQYILFVPQIGFYTDIDNSVSRCSGIIPFNPYYSPDVEKLEDVKQKIRIFNDK